MRSRRGFQGRKKKRKSSGVAEEVTTVAPDHAHITQALNVDAVSARNDAETTQTLEVDSVMFAAANAFLPPNQEDIQDKTEETVSIPPLMAKEFEYDKLITVYYRDIHPAHPIVLPRKFYQQDREVLPVHLKITMAFMASHLVSDDYDGLRDEAERVLDMNLPNDGFTVQTLLLLTLTFYARFERDRGNRALTNAIALASCIGMDQNSFSHSQHLIFQESWRRTYWELYIISGLISLIAGTNFRLRPSDGLLLPGHCEDYNEGRIAEARDLRAMRNRVSMEIGFGWSSFAYKIEAMRIMSSVLEGEDADEVMADTQVQAFGASVSGFLLSLPEDKRMPVTDDGSIDEVMSCGLMIINLAGICLHFPRSSLAGRASFKTVCGSDRSDKTESQDERFHRAAVVRYANGLSKLISSRHSLRTLTPCFSCSIAFAAAVHLAAILPRDKSEAQHKEHIQLELSALNIISAIWPIGSVVKSQLAQYSRDVLSHHIPQTSNSSPGVPDNDLLSLSLVNEPWLDELTSQYIDAPGEGFLFNLMGRPENAFDPNP